MAFKAEAVALFCNIDAAAFPLCQATNLLISPLKPFLTFFMCFPHQFLMFFEFNEGSPVSHEGTFCETIAHSLCQPLPSLSHSSTAI
jgi:hypothetical protein